MSTPDTVFTPMMLVDVPLVGELEPLCFPAPWAAETYRNELLHNQYSHYWVLRPAGEGERELPPILAYGGYWLMGDEAHVVTIATHPEYRRRGLGEHLLRCLIDEAEAGGAASITLEVRATNESAQQMYIKWGFVEVGLRKGYYHDNGEDAILMTLFLD